MNRIQKTITRTFGQLEQRIFGKKKYTTTPSKLRIPNWYSNALNREVVVDLYFPPDWVKGMKMGLLVLNDGQDLERMNFHQIYSSFYRNDFPYLPFMVVAIHASFERMSEYGVASKPDYLNRGNKAKLYDIFLTKEILPWIHRDYEVKIIPSRTVIAGFSLGGLSALDLAWHHADTFGKVGIFSGSLWWRSKPFNPNNPDADLIIHHLIENDYRRPDVEFWFQTGTNDETDDRNNNGVIDAIDDTLSLIHILKNKKKYKANDIHYEEVKNGEHNPETWSKVMPNFLEWAFKC